MEQTKLFTFPDSGSFIKNLSFSQTFLISLVCRVIINKRLKLNRTNSKCKHKLIYKFFSVKIKINRDGVAQLQSKFHWFLFFKSNNFLSIHRSSMHAHFESTDIGSRKEKVKIVLLCSRTRLKLNFTIYT